MIRMPTVGSEVFVNDAFVVAPRLLVLQPAVVRCCRQAAKQCASDPKNADQQRLLREAAEDLRTATSVAASDVLRKKMIKRLEVRVPLVEIVVGMLLQ